jgi:hypothetical protein
MNNEVYLAIASILCFGFAGMNLAFNDANPILPGWILLGVIFGTVAVAVAVLGSGDDADAAEA